jgi:hypothetical protein
MPPSATRRLLSPSLVSSLSFNFLLLLWHSDIDGGLGGGGKYVVIVVDGDDGLGGKYVVVVDGDGGRHVSCASSDAVESVGEGTGDASLDSDIADADDATELAGENAFSSSKSPVAVEAMMIC